LQIIRPFGEPVETLVDEDIKQWIGKNERPTVYPFNERTISEIFSESASAIILFQSPVNGEALNEAFAEAANQWRVVAGKNFIFTDIPPTGQHYGGLAEYIKIDVARSPIVFLDGGKRSKHILAVTAPFLTAEKIIAFAESIESGTAQ